MRIALDATYSVDPHPSGIAVYSRELMRGLPALHTADEFYLCYRPKQWGSRKETAQPNVKSRVLLRPFSPGRPRVFHALNQRIDWRPAPTVISTFHDLFVMTADYSAPEFRRRFTEQARNAAQRSDIIIAVSEFTAGQVVDLLGVNRAKIRVIPHGVHQLSLDFSVPRENIILFVGALQRRKNIISLVKAFEQLESRWKLVLAGAPGGYGSVEIMNYIDASKSRDRIQVVGYLPDDALQKLYARARIFAFPSLDEGFGIPVLEAMAHGIPVVTSDRAALREVAGDAALLIDPDRVDSITDALASLIANEDLQTDLARRGCKRADQFRWSTSISTTYNLYKELAAT